LDKRSAEAVRLPLVTQHLPDISAFIAVVRRLSIARSLQEIMQTATPAARTLLGADGITFVLREGDLCYYAEEDAISPLWKGKRFPMSACISGWCMSERQGTAIEDIYSDPRIPHEAYRPTFVRSLAMVPVRQDDPIAAMGAYWRDRRVIERSELDLLQAIANVAGLAVANIQLSEERERANRARQELGHRIRNLLTLVSALARETFRTRSDESTAAFLERLQALARAQGLLEELGQAGADIRTLVQEQVLLGGSAERVTCSGPHVVLPPDEALDLTLVLHELGTNARKYGALSHDGGRIAIEWSVRTEANQSAVVLSWTEQDGPPVQKPLNSGFGSSLLRLAFSKNGGATELHFDEDGVICHMKIPLP
jgi:two-component sensor histidine kinase